MTRHLSQTPPPAVERQGELGLRHRPRRLRRSAANRALVRETRLSADLLI